MHARGLWRSRSAGIVRAVGLAVLLRLRWHVDRRCLCAVPYPRRGWRRADYVPRVWPGDDAPVTRDRAIYIWPDVLERDIRGPSCGRRAKHSHWVCRTHRFAILYLADITNGWAGRVGHLHQPGEHDLIWYCDIDARLEERPIALKRLMRRVVAAS
jgi:hypothetical protein